MVSSVSSLTASQAEPRPLYRLRTFYVLPAVNAYASFTATDVYVPWVEGEIFLRLCTCIISRAKGVEASTPPMRAYSSVNKRKCMDILSKSIGKV